MTFPQRSSSNISAGVQLTGKISGFGCIDPLAQICYRYNVVIQFPEAETRHDPG